MNSRIDYFYKLIEELKNIKKKYPGCSIYIFGSYIWGKPRNDSDIDIAIFAKNTSEYFDIHDDIEDSNSIFNFDILYLNTMTNISLKERILKDGMQI